MLTSRVHSAISLAERVFWTAERTAEDGDRPNGQGIELLVFSLSDLHQATLHGWVDLAKYFELTPGRYRASVTVDPACGDRPAKMTAADMEFEIGEQAATAAR